MTSKSPRWKSALLPKNAPHVIEFEVGGESYVSYASVTGSIDLHLFKGYIPMLPKSGWERLFKKALCDSFETWSNLRVLTITPESCLAGFFSVPLTDFQDRCLRRLTINSACWTQNSLGGVLQLCDLEALTLVKPDRVMLDGLAEWLPRMSSTLKELHVRVRTPPLLLRTVAGHH